ncbi:MAG: DUF6152 family protein [Hyphomicrobiaceae bacterium]|nr:DUF6152 family protein [Hyphomicrobiaceae bacterium]
MPTAMRFLPLILLCFGLLMPSSGNGHHTYVTKYDAGKVVTLKGTVGSVSYQNPHITFTLATTNGSWTIETESIPKVQAKGLTQAVLADGAEASATGWPARDGGAELGLKSITIKGRTYTIRNTAR